MTVIAETVNRSVQLGFETSPGVPAGGGATHAMRALMVEVASEHTNKAYTSQGHRHASKNAQQKRWEALNITGDVLYPETLMVLEALFGPAAPTLIGTIAQKRVYAPPLSGKVTPRTWQIQYGDPADNVNQALFGLLTGFGMKYTRDTGLVWNGVKGVSLPHATGASFTASPTEFTNAPIEGSHVNFYLDTTGAGIGTTQIIDEVLDADFAYDGVHGPRWTSDRAKLSYADYVNLVTKPKVKLSLAESSVVRAIEASMEANATYFLRIDAQGPVIDASPLTHFQFQADFAIQLDKSTALSADGQGVDKRDFDFIVVEDTTWGHAAQFTVVTDIATI
jgi:hypothetical protein